MKKIKFIFLWLLIPLFIFSEPLFNAQIYREDSNREELLFNYTNQITIDEEKTILTHLYSNLSGELFTKEEVLILSGEFIQHNTDFYLLEEYSQLLRNKESVEITYSGKGKSKKKVVPLSENLVFGPTQQRFIQDNLSTLREGEEIIFQLPAPEFTTLTDFTLERVYDSEYEREGMMVLKMESKSFFLSLIVGQNYFVVDQGSGLIWEIHGPSLLKVFERGKWRFVDVEIVFTYEGLSEIPLVKVEPPIQE